jgi:hypothetical protein
LEFHSQQGQELGIESHWQVAGSDDPAGVAKGCQHFSKCGALPNTCTLQFIEVLWRPGDGGLASGGLTSGDANPMNQRYRLYRLMWVEWLSLFSYVGLTHKKRVDGRRIHLLVCAFCHLFTQAQSLD